MKVVACSLDQVRGYRLLIHLPGHWPSPHSAKAAAHSRAWAPPDNGAAFVPATNHRYLGAIISHLETARALFSLIKLGLLCNCSGEPVNELGREGPLCCLSQSTSLPACLRLKGLLNLCPGWKEFPSCTSTPSGGEAARAHLQEVRPS
ncbi:hypothetical protein NDU88_001419 [Pleurodeles waltl]|uniref:Uncharacterized protein n=1 Tax=Pleurodeles waltl TaxID=8319 RepID=A0AAV7LXK9_PLEWA|nr:hypothetical protein NDU88_001419 [Pleurodeles waltl]